MISIRNHVFETNSSTEHCLTVQNGMRDIGEFPIPDDGGVVHIPLLYSSDELEDTSTFVKLVQHVILCTIDGQGYARLFTLDGKIMSQLYYLIVTAYKMAGIFGVDDIIFDFPQNVTGIELLSNGTIGINHGYLESNCFQDNFKSVIQHLAAYMKGNNVAIHLVKQYTSCDEDYQELNYAAAALAMRTTGEYV